jgi:16S rRNA (cytosine1402-N4)-methyltransferase
MAAEVVGYLQGCPSGVFLDATVNGGGHTSAIYKAFKDIFTCVGFDLDGEVIEQTRQTFKDEGIKADLVKLNFADIAGYLPMKNIGSISAILYDLGISSYQIDNPRIGFSYLDDGPLNLSFEDSQTLAAARLIQRLSEQKLAELFKMYGQEPRSKALARAIKNSHNKIETTGQLAAIIRGVVGSKYFIKTAARVFQSLRIEVNDELGNIQQSLESVLPLLKPGGKAIVISYHSLEDGLVKKIFKKYSGKCVCPSNLPECRCGKNNLVRWVTRKPVKPGVDEIASNPRARSAKMRVVERVAA